jgi:AcrR family transcriptional regulator
MAMVAEKGYEATTVQDIIDRANVGRATFYSHFADKETLLGSRLEDLRGFLTQRQRQAPGSLAFCLALLEHARAHVPVWGAIVGRKTGALVLQRIHDIVADLVDADLGALAFARTPAERNLAVQYIAGAFVAVMTWWVSRGAKATPDEVNAIFHRLVMQGLEGDLTLRANHQDRRSAR